MTPDQFFLRLQNGLPVLKRQIIADTAVQLEQFVDQNFAEGGFYNTAFKKWKDRKNGDKSRPVLVKSGDLRRAATDARRKGDGVEVRINLPYAQAHNEGTSKLPKRQFIGNSSVLQDLIERRIKMRITQFLTN